MTQLPYNRAGVEAMTIGAVVGQALLLVFHCHACGRVGQADAEKLKDRYGPGIKLRALKAKARCSNCEKKNLAVLLKRPNALHRRDAWVPYKPDDPMR
jgi:hypothetical protein